MQFLRSFGNSIIIAHGPKGIQVLKKEIFTFPHKIQENVATENSLVF